MSGAAEAVEAGGCAPRAGMLGVKKADKAVAAILARRPAYTRERKRERERGSLAAW